MTENENDPSRGSLEVAWRDTWPLTYLPQKPPLFFFERPTPLPQTAQTKKKKGSRPKWHNAGSPLFYLVCCLRHTHTEEKEPEDRPLFLFFSLLVIAVQQVFSFFRGISHKNRREVDSIQEKEKTKKRELFSSHWTPIESPALWECVRIAFPCEEWFNHAANESAFLLFFPAKIPPAFLFLFSSSDKQLGKRKEGNWYSLRVLLLFFVENLGSSAVCCVFPPLSLHSQNGLASLVCSVADETPSGFVAVSAWRRDIRFHPRISAQKALYFHPSFPQVVDTLVNLKTKEKKKRKKIILLNNWVAPIRVP